MNKVTVLDYGAGNIRSVLNAIKALGYEVKLVERGEDILSAWKLIFPGVGAFGEMIESLESRGLLGPLREYLLSGRPYLGICLGMQILFEESEEAKGKKGLGIFKGKVRLLRTDFSIPHIGWNGIKPKKPSQLFNGLKGSERFYFVHSYVVEPLSPEIILSKTDYGEEFVSSVQSGKIVGIQFHPEKSGQKGLKLLENFLKDAREEIPKNVPQRTELSRRILACLDVRADDEGRLVVTKGDRYDVRDKETKRVRDLGDPVELADFYYREGADEIVFLNIVGFRNYPLVDLPMLDVLRRTSERVFVPLTIGGGIRGYKDESGVTYSALDVAREYFRSGADKVSIGSDAVYAAIEFLKDGRTGRSSIEEISRVYGRQAVVVSIDPIRRYIKDPAQTKHRFIRTDTPGPEGERFCTYLCTVKGGREVLELDAFTLSEVVEELGCGEILLNSIDRDGTKLGYDIELIKTVSDLVKIPVIASSGAGKMEHFLEVFEKTKAQAALGAGVFHRKEIRIGDLKEFLSKYLPIRLD